MAEEGADRSSFKRAEAVSRARGIEISASKIREVTLRRGKEEYERPIPAKIDLKPKGACGGKRRRTALTMVVSTDGTCAPCAAADLEEVKGRDGNPAKCGFSRKSHQGLGVRQWAIGMDGSLFLRGQGEKEKIPPLLPIA